MKASMVTVAALAGLASAQFSGVPSCAVPCLTSAISDVGCGASDIACQCSSTDAIQATGAGCILAACTAAGELQSAISGGLALCSAYLATVSASATPSTTPSAAVTTTTVVSTSSVATSTVTVETTSVASPSTTPAPIVGNGTVVAPTGSVTPSASPSVSEVPVSNAAQLVAGLGGLVGLVAAFVAAL